VNDAIEPRAGNAAAARDMTSMNPTCSPKIARTGMNSTLKPTRWPTIANGTRRSPKLDDAVDSSRRPGKQRQNTRARRGCNRGLTPLIVGEATPAQDPIPAGSDSDVTEIERVDSSGVNVECYVDGCLEFTGVLSKICFPTWTWEGCNRTMPRACSGREPVRFNEERRCAG
jgi:hypothetical protein